MDKPAALSAVQEATGRTEEASDELDRWTRELRRRVRVAGDLGASHAELARMTGRHRNTIATWCVQEEEA